MDNPREISGQAESDYYYISDLDSIDGSGPEELTGGDNSSPQGNYK